MICTLDKDKISTIKKALKTLGKKNMVFIMHNGSFPSAPDENTGFGTVNSSAGKAFIDYAAPLFDAIQMGPAGKTKSSDSSPYCGTIFSNNPLFIDLKQLTTEAYENFIKLNDKKLMAKFNTYKLENDSWLDKDSLYEALSIEHGTDYWPNWKNKTDKNLFNPKSYEEKIEFGKRTDETKKYPDSKGIKMIADRQVAFSDRDSWAYQSLFLDGWCLGCPPDYFSKDGQAWGFPVIDPEKLYNQDGSLGEAGMLMKNLFKKMFKENPGGVRIDHIVGLIDPWVYKSGKKPMPEQGAGRLYSSPEHPELKKYAIIKEEDLDTTLSSDNEKRVKNLSKEQIKLYGRLIEKIVIAAAKEEGLTKDSIVCEDLGTLTNPVASVMKEYDLLGMRLTQFTVPTEEDDPYRCKNITNRCWAMIGTHDNQPVSLWAKSLVHTHEGYLHVKNLVEDLFKETSDKDALIVQMTNDENFLKETKLVELFACQAENIQIFFTDFFGMDKTYNTPGTSGDKNWSLRLPDNFAQMETINLPLILKKAIIARGSEFEQQNKEIIEELDEIQ